MALLPIFNFLATTKYDAEFIEDFNTMRNLVETGEGWPGGPTRPQAFLCGLAKSSVYNAKDGRYDVEVYGSKVPRFSQQKPFIFSNGETIDTRKPYIFS